MKLPDINFWLALTLQVHPHQPIATDWLVDQIDKESVAFCRATQHSLLRLLSTNGVLQQYGMAVYSNAEAWGLYEKLLADVRITYVEEPADLQPLWRQFSFRNTASPKLWMDAYLAAFAIRADCELITFDQGFQQYPGLTLGLLGVT